MAQASLQTVKDAIAELQSTVDNLERNGQITLDTPSSFAIANTSLRLGRQTNPPLAAGFEVVMSSQVATAVRLAIDLQIFKSLAAAFPSPLTADQLAEKAQQHVKVEVDPHFIVRVLRMITIYHVVSEVGPRTYVANDKTLAFGAEDGSLEGLHRHFCDLYQHVFQHSVDYFKQNGYKMPDDPTKGPYQSWTKTEGTTAYDYWLTLPGVVDNFNNFMKALETSHWYTWYDAVGETKKHLTAAGKAADGLDELLLVDVGGGKGGLVHGLRSHLTSAGLKGRLVLEEREAVIRDALHEAAAAGHSTNEEGMPGVEYIVHDFFQPQPETAQGALYYYVHWIMHNWSDDNCLKILSGIARAMTKGYSRLMINERVLAEEGNDLKSAGLDFHMAYAHSAKERTLSEFTSLIEQVGMEVVGYHKAPDGGEDIVEYMLA